jgi:hypothetical protein
VENAVSKPRSETATHGGDEPGSHPTFGKETQRLPSGIEPVRGVQEVKASLLEGFPTSGYVNQDPLVAHYTPDQVAKLKKKRVMTPLPLTINTDTAQALINLAARLEKLESKVESLGSETLTMENVHQIEVLERKLEHLRGRLQTEFDQYNWDAEETPGVELPPGNTTPS